MAKNVATKTTKTTYPICWKCGAKLVYSGQISCVKCGWVQAKGRP